MTKTNLSPVINQALGAEKADLVIKNVTVLNVLTGEQDVTDIAVTGNRIVGLYERYDGKHDIDGTGMYAVPGFIDTHVHIESSLVTPYEFDRCVLPHGTTTVVCDPHEMSNVLGAEALDYFITSSEGTVQDQFVNLSSCVPATPLETSGASLDAKTLLRFKDHKNVIGLAEFMDIGGVLGQNPDTLEKLEAFEGEHIDGHMPSGVSGYAMNAMAACGIRNCHESTELSHAQEKLRKGLQVFIREGSVCNDLHTLAELITPFQSPHLGFCTDDRKPLDIREQGHLDYIIRTAIDILGDDPETLASVYRVASWSAAQGFGLHKNNPKWQARGVIAPGYQADIVLVGDLAKCDVQMVVKDGKPVTDKSFENRPEVKLVGRNSVHLDKVGEADLQIQDDNNGEQDVIGLIQGQIVTQSLTATLPVDTDGHVHGDPDQDIAKIAVLERHGKNGNIAKAFVQGFGLKDGAIASSVGHDSHNVTVVGASDRDMALAVNRLRDMQGGFVVVKDGKVDAELALPVAGLMSDQDADTVCVDLKALRQSVSKLCPHVKDPFMMLSFLPLCVIPKLKLTDFGLVRFDPENGDQAPVLIKDQRLKP